MSVRPNPDHPARFSPEVLAALQDIVDAERARMPVDLNTRRRMPPAVLDPFAGVGRIHDLDRCITVGVELEPEWAACRAGTIVGDATRLAPLWTGTFDVVCTSPVYPNRMTDHHDNRDLHKACKGAGCRGCKTTGVSPRKNYRASLGRMPSEGSAAVMGWGPAYRNLHRAAVGEMARVVKPGGLVVVNMSDHVKGDETVPVVLWWRWALEDAGLKVRRVVPVDTRRFRNGANRDVRAGNEVIIQSRKPEGGDGTPTEETE